jgi:DNA-binding response OmpR family regulator
VPHRILIAEDDSDSRELLTILLSLEGYEPISAQDGAEAPRIARQTQPDLILLDIMMPVVDGFTFRDIQLKDQALASVPVIAMTALDHRQIAERLQTDCLQKPIEFDELLQRVRQVCAP